MLKTAKTIVNKVQFSSVQLKAVLDHKKKKPAKIRIEKKKAK